MRRNAYKAFLVWSTQICERYPEAHTSKCLRRRPYCAEYSQPHPEDKFHGWESSLLQRQVERVDFQGPRQDRGRHSFSLGWLLHDSLISRR